MPAAKFTDVAKRLAEIAAHIAEFAEAHPELVTALLGLLVEAGKQSSAAKK